MMKIEFRAGPEDEGLREYVDGRLWSWIGHLERDLDVVTVCLSRHGTGGRSRCRMVTRPVPWTDIAVEEADVDPYAAIDRSTERLTKHLELVLRAGIGERGAA